MSSDPGIETRPTATLRGLAASRGLAAGPVFLYAGDRILSVPEYVVPADRVMDEFVRYHAARTETHRQLENLSEKFSAATSSTEANIFANHLAILDDPLVIEQIGKAIREERLNVEAAVRRVVGKYCALLRKMNDPYLRERVYDVEDVERRFQRVLMGSGDSSLASVTEPVVVAAEDITPSETVALPREFVLGFVLDHGSTTSHAALLARALGIPAVLGLGDVTKRVTPGERILLDGTAGTVTVHPDDAAAAAFGRRIARERAALAALAADPAQPAALKDGTAVTILANTQPGVPFESLAAFGAQGVGLYRTEYLWLRADRAPDEEEQFATYAAAVRAAAQHLGETARVTFRCLDLGGDKLMRGTAPTEANPFLGNRSIRWLLAHRDQFRAQLRALLRASAFGRTAVMFPLVATLGEVRACKRELAAAKAELAAAHAAFDAGVPCGVMIETPAAALMADQLAREVDFFSIGTNDLVQYALAADRGNEQVAYLSRPTDPAVIRLVDMTCRAARAAEIPVCVCGESAADPVLAVLWLGLGVDTLSMSANGIPAVRKALAEVTADEARRLAQEVLARCRDLTADEIASFCRARLERANVSRER